MGGVFTATEGGGIGAGGAFAIALWRKALSVKVLVDVLSESIRTTSMLFMIFIGAMVFSNFINLTTMPDDLKSLISTLKIHPALVIVAICTLYVVLGTAMEEISMILLTVPLLFPIVTDPIWFGIIIVLVVQIGMISPPVGMNLFVIRALLPNIRLAMLFRGVIPFCAVLIVMLGVMIAFPELALFLPRRLG